ASEAAFVRVRAALTALEACLNRATTKIADLIVDNYTEPRSQAILGPSGSMSMKTLKARHFYGPNEKDATPLKYVVQIRAGAVGPTSRQARIQEVLQLYALGAVDDQAVLDAFQFRGAQDVLKRLYYKRQLGLIGHSGAGA